MSVANLCRKGLIEKLHFSASRAPNKIAMKSFDPSINQHNTNNARNHLRKAWNENKQNPESFYDFTLLEANERMTQLEMFEEKQEPFERKAKRNNNNNNRSASVGNKSRAECYTICYFFTLHESFVTCLNHLMWDGFFVSRLSFCFVTTQTIDGT